MKPEYKAFFIDKDTNLEEIENLLSDGYQFVPIPNDKLFILAKLPEKKIKTFEKK